MTQNLPLYDTPGAIDPGFLPLLAKTLVPSTVKASISINYLINPRNHPYNALSGSWLVHAGEDESGYMLIHWPTVTRRLLTDRALDPTFLDYGLFTHQPKIHPTQHPEAFEHQWSSFRRWFRAHLPPGAELSSEAPFIRKLHCALHPRDQISTQFTTFRVGTWHSTRIPELGQKIEAYSCFRQLSSLSPKIRDRCPPFLDLLIDALIEATDKSCINGFDSWGLAWTRKGLVFHFVRALERCRRTPHLMRKYSGDIFEEYIAPWSNRAAFDVHPVISGAARLADYCELADYGYGPKAIAPYSLSVEDYDHQIGKLSYLDNYLYLFPLPGKGSLIQQLEILLRADRVGEAGDTLSSLEAGQAEQESSGGEPHLLEAGQSVTETFAKIPKTKRVSPRKQSRLGLDWGDFAYFDPDDPETIGALDTVTIIKQKSTHYVSWPFSLATVLPELEQKHRYQPSRGKNRFLWTDRRKGVKRTNESHVLSYRAVKMPKAFPAAYKTDGRVHMHPELLRPDGEAVGLALAMASIHYNRNSFITPTIRALENLCRFIHEPQEGIARGLFGLEYRLLVASADDADCPITLSTRDDRLEYLYEKGLRIVSPNVCYAPPGGRTGVRSKRINDVDRFMLWYAARHEMTQLPWTLTKLQQAEYVAKRFLFWRRPSGCLHHLVKPKYWEKDVRLPPLGDDDPTNERTQVELVALPLAQEYFGRAFTAV